MIPAHDHLRALLADHDPRCELCGITRPRNGLVNQVFCLATTRGDYVLKVFDDAAGRWKPQKERAIFEHLRSVGVPAPRVERIDVSRRVAPFIYSLTERCPGESFSAIAESLSESETLRVYALLGDYLGRLHGTTFDSFGDVAGAPDGLRVVSLREWEGHNMQVDVGPFSTWRDMHTAIVDGRIRFLRGTLFADVIPVVERYFDEHSALIGAPITPRLLHMDLHGGNVLIHDGRVSAILDVEEAVAGHNEYDLMRTELALFRGEPPTFAQEFLHAYEQHVPLEDGYETRKRFYDVSRTLVWMKSLVMYGDNYAGGFAQHSHEAARAHLRSLLAS